MLWKVVKGVVVLACEVAGIGVIPAALNMVGVLTTVVTIILGEGLDDAGHLVGQSNGDQHFWLASQHLRKA